MYKNIQEENMQKVKIKIKNLRLRSIIGISADEKRDRQDLVINAEIDYFCNSFEKNSLNYRTITKCFINEVDGKEFDLLEEVAQILLDRTFEFEQVEKAVIEVDKPHALRFSDSVSITLQKTK